MWVRAHDPSSALEERVRLHVSTVLTLMEEFPELTSGYEPFWTW